jgi:transposase-like protein
MTQSKMVKRHRFPPEIIQYAVWLCRQFNLSHRDIEDLLAERGMGKFRSMHQAQPFLNAHAAVYNLFNLKRHLFSAENYRYFRQRAFASWESAAAISI